MNSRSLWCLGFRLLESIAKAWTFSFCCAEQNNLKSLPLGDVQLLYLMYQVVSESQLKARKGLV